MQQSLIQLFRLLIITLAFAGAALAEETAKLPDLGPAWFARLREPKTRLKAVHEWEKEKAKTEKREWVDDFEKFAAERENIFVLPCPQPKFPKAWLVISSLNWTRSQEILIGPEPECYDPHPLEIERRRQWKENGAADQPNFIPWKPGQPWMEFISGFLVDESGKQLDDEFYSCPALIADFNQDGMLDLAKFASLSVKAKLQVEMDIDSLSIGPLVTSQPRYAILYCNQRKTSDPKDWLFDVRSDAPGLFSLVLVPSDNDKQKKEITFQFKKGKLTPSTELPKDILLDQEPLADGEESCCYGNPDFLRSHGLEVSGVGVDELKNVQAGHPSKRTSFLQEDGEWPFPETKDLAPRPAAQAMANHQFSSSVREHYELGSVGEPLPLAKQGWLEQWNDGGGWADDSVVVWWLKGDTAEMWAQNDQSFNVTKLRAEDVARQITISHELNLVRSIPKDAFAPSEDHGRDGAADIPIFQVRAFSKLPMPLASVFKRSAPYCWRTVGSRYDRDVASAIATSFTGIYPKKSSPGTESHSIHDLAPLWLDPQKVSEIPPGLSRAAVHAIAKNRWLDRKPLLEKLLTSLGEPSPDELRLVEIERFIEAERNRTSLPDREERPAQRKLLDIKKEQRNLILKLTGNTAFELRAPIKKALRELSEAK